MQSHTYLSMQIQQNYFCRFILSMESSWRHVHTSTQKNKRHYHHHHHIDRWWSIGNQETLVVISHTQTHTHTKSNQATAAAIAATSISTDIARPQRAIRNLLPCRKKPSESCWLNWSPFFGFFGLRIYSIVASLRTGNVLNGSPSCSFVRSFVFFFLFLFHLFFSFCSLDFFTFRRIRDFCGANISVLWSHLSHSALRIGPFSPVYLCVSV